MGGLEATFCPRLKDFAFASRKSVADSLSLASYACCQSSRVESIIDNPNMGDGERLEEWKDKLDLDIEGVMRKEMDALADERCVPRRGNR